VEEETGFSAAGTVKAGSAFLTVTELVAVSALACGSHPIELNPIAY